MEAIERELAAATKLKARKNEDRQDYLTRLMKAVSRLDNDPWGDLTTAAQDWTNEAAKSYNEGTPIVDFGASGGEVEVPKEEAPEEVQNAPEEPSEADEVQGVSPSESPTEEMEEPSKPVRGRAGATRKSACHMIKTWVVKDPKITVKDIAAKLRSKGLKVSDVTIASLRSSVRDTLRVMRELDMIDVKL